MREIVMNDEIVEMRGGEDEKKGRGLTPVKVGVVTKQII